MPFFRRHKRVLWVIAGLLLLAGGFCFSAPWTDAPSPFTGPPMAGVSARTEQSRYSPAAREISLTVSSSSAEFYAGCHAVLERQQGGVWYTLRRNPFCRIVPPAMEIGILPGEEERCRLLAEEYGFRLRPGVYRAVVKGCDSMRRETFAAAEFEIG